MNLAWKIIRGILIALGLAALMGILAVSCGVSLVEKTFDSGGDNLLSEPEVYTFTDIESLDLELSVAKLNIIPGETFSLESNGKYVECYQEGRTLVVEEENRWSLFQMQSPTLTLTIPQGAILNTAIFDLGAGQVSIKGLTCQTLDLELGAGEFVAWELQATDSAKIQGGAGEITIHNGSLQNLTLDMGTGELHMEAYLPGNSTIRMGLGQAILDLLGNREDYGLSMSLGIGSATVDGKTVTRDQTYGTGPNTITISGGIGETTIRFTQHND